MINWISVKDRLPETDGWIVWCKASSGAFMEITPCEFECLYWDCEFNNNPVYLRQLSELYKFTHWAEINLPTDGGKESR